VAVWQAGRWQAGGKPVRQQTFRRQASKRTAEPEPGMNRSRAERRSRKGRHSKVWRGKREQAAGR